MQFQSVVPNVYVAVGRMLGAVPFQRRNRKQCILFVCWLSTMMTSMELPKISPRSTPDRPGTRLTKGIYELCEVLQADKGGRRL